MILERYGTDLMKLVVRTVQFGLAKDKPPSIALHTFAKELQMPRATFVTLEREGSLRGCIGSLVASKSLVEDVVDNAFRAAFRDPRYPKLEKNERKGLGLSISVLTPMSPVSFTDEASFARQIRPGLDGLLIQEGSNRAVFLPQVWQQLQQTSDFVAQLKLKAGLPEDYWSDSIKTWRFTVQRVPPLGIRRDLAKKKAEAAAREVATPVVDTGDEPPAISEAS